MAPRGTIWLICSVPLLTSCSLGLSLRFDSQSLFDQSGPSPFTHLTPSKFHFCRRLKKQSMKRNSWWSTWLTLPTSPRRLKTETFGKSKWSRTWSKRTSFSCRWLIRSFEFDLKGYCDWMVCGSFVFVPCVSWDLATPTDWNTFASIPSTTTHTFPSWTQRLVKGSLHGTLLLLPWSFPLEVRTVSFFWKWKHERDRRSNACPLPSLSHFEWKWPSFWMSGTWMAQHVQGLIPLPGSQRSALCWTWTKRNNFRPFLLLPFRNRLPKVLPPIASSLWISVYLLIVII